MMSEEAMLKVDDIRVHNGTVPVLKSVSLEVGRNEIVSVIGANGAGKSTMLKAISGLLPVQHGSIFLDGKDITPVASYRRARMGICQAQEGRGIFGSLTVMDNLLLGASTASHRRKKGEAQQDLDQVYDIFPRLKERRKQLGGTMSGGEQQMLALARAFLGRPKIMLLDEPSLGLAPLLVREIFRIIRELSQRGVPILLVEQNAKAALEISDRGYVLETGQVTMCGTCEELLSSEDVKSAYLGASVLSKKHVPEPGQAGNAGDGVTVDQ